MPNLKSAKKELRKSKSRTAHNEQVRQEIKKMVKGSRRAIDAKTAEAVAMVKQTIKTLDKAVKKGVIKKNTASRKKSRLQKRLNVGQPIAAAKPKAKSKTKK
ncbi:MAG TPA: 30S ribosomal protein S20 [bacterium]|jgi:small subunit ribosomal protein S20|nr:30S ribosomal protein S20 [bacterium]HNZ51506.1 30S ribosomal protein S20 [bacterium]HOF79582.1 30S ribosomal protein S20 [bacterium]HOH85530.1 30S ribosomal protein S20 [bacterium]HOQ91445.1 30S ribosomal protein S20 [bacterium]